MKRLFYPINAPDLRQTIDKAKEPPLKRKSSDKILESVVCKVPKIICWIVVSSMTVHLHTHFVIAIIAIILNSFYEWVNF